MRSDPRRRLTLFLAALLLIASCTSPEQPIGELPAADEVLVEQEAQPAAVEAPVERETEPTVVEAPAQPEVEPTADQVVAETQAATETPPPPTESAPTPVPETEMILIPAGEFLMGSETGRSSERPVHPVYLDAYWIDITPVTNAQFAVFLNEQGNRPVSGEPMLRERTIDCPIDKVEGEFVTKSGFEDHPVLFVTWHAAAAYCEWRGSLTGETVRLPTEAEWEKAAGWDPATGTMRVYPWGDTWDSALANADRPIPITNTTEVGIHTVPVGIEAGNVSPYGVYGMAGNAWEWVADWYAADYYVGSPEANPQGPESGEEKVVRGGSWRSTEKFVRTTVRHGLSVSYTFDVSFRCAKE